MRFYIASKLENAERVRSLRDRLTSMGHSPTYDWTEHGSVQEEGEARIRQVAEAELRGVLEADVVIVLFPGGRGTHTELGAAIAHAVLLEAVGSPYGKGIVLIGDQPSHDGRTCAFYHHPAVVRVSDDDTAIGVVCAAFNDGPEVRDGDAGAASQTHQQADSDAEEVGHG